MKLSEAHTLADDSATLELSGALARLRGDHPLLLDLMRFYLADWPGLRDALRRSLAEENRDAFERAAHSIKGLAANFDAAPVVDTAHAAERGARDQPWDLLAPMVDAVEAAGGRLTGQLEAYLASHQDN